MFCDLLNNGTDTQTPEPANDSNPPHDFGHTNDDHSQSPEVFQSLLSTADAILVDSNEVEPLTVHQEPLDVFILADTASVYTITTDAFTGACIDTGAARSVIGKSQAKAYCRAFKRPYSLRPSAVLFQFGIGKQRSLGIIDIRIPVADQII